MDPKPKHDLMELASLEREDLLAFLEGLTVEQWEGPSLCSGWNVREVVAHILSFEDLSIVGLGWGFIRGGFRPNAVNEVALRGFRGCTADELKHRLSDHLRPQGLTALMGGGIALADGLIHHQDIRRGLGQPRVVPVDRLRAVLPIAVGAPTLPSRRNVKGLRLTATDLEWTHGEGPEVNGPAESLLMAMAGRPDALADLEGPGVAVLAAKIR